MVNLLVVNFVTQWSTVRNDLKLIYTHAELFTDLNNQLPYLHFVVDLHYILMLVRLKADRKRDVVLRKITA